MKFGFRNLRFFKSSCMKIFCYICIFVISVFVLNFTVSTLLAPSHILDQSSVIVLHGPNPNTELIAPESMSATATVAIQSIGQSQDGVKTVSLGRVGEYGIAAGGGLIYLDQNGLNKYFDSLKALGVRWVRWDIDWGVIQPKNSTEYQWERADRVVMTAKRYGIESLGIITYTPAWATDESCVKKLHCEPANPKDFGYFAGEVASRYKDTIIYWEIWNEPNYTFFWKPKPNIENYAAVLKESYIAIKKANPAAVVLNGGLAATGNEIDGSISPIDFIRTLYVQKANQYFDAVSLHPYTYPALPSYRAWWNRWQQIVPIHQLMVTNGDGEKKIWITEFGVPTGGPGEAYAANQLREFRYGVDFMYENSQRYLMTEATNFYRQHIDWMGPFFWYSLKDSSNERDTTENFFGLLHYDGSKKPAYDLLKQLIASSTEQ